MNKHRGGCIVCMDYGRFSKNNYFTLVSEFRDIKSVLISKLRLLNDLGFQPQKAYLFGFSFGAHLVMEAAEAIGVQQYQQIDGKYIVYIDFEMRFAQKMIENYSL